MTMSRLTGRVFSLLLALFFAVGISMAQTTTYTDWTINGDVVNNGTIRVGRDIINNTTGTVHVTGTGVVRLYGNVGAITAHALRSTTGTYPISFTWLDLRANRPTTCNVDITVTDTLRIGDRTTAYTAAGVGFSIGSRTLTLGRQAYYMPTSTAALTFSGGTVNYTLASGSQNVLVSNATTTYGTLGLTGNANMTIPNAAAGSVAAATLTHSGTGTLTVNDTTNITTSASIGTLATVASGKLLRFSGSATSSIATVSANAGTIQNNSNQALNITTVTTNAGTIDNASTGTTTITTLAANAGTISESGVTGTMAFTNSAASNGTITNSSTGGTITFVKNLSGTGTISQTSSGTINVGGSFVQNTYTLTGTNGTVVYDSGSAQSIIATSYYHLTISSATDTTIANYKTAAGAITLTGNLVVNSGNTLDMQGYVITSPGGSSSNSGKIKWSADNAYVGGSGVTEFYGSTTGNIAAGSNYGDLLFSGTGMKTFGTSPITATGNMTVNSGASVTVGSVTLNINGRLNAIGNITNNGTVNVGP